MTSMICVSILPFLLSFSVLLSNAQYCSDTGNFTTNSTYDQNRRLLLSSLASNVTADGGLSTMTVDQHSEKLYGLALCLDSSSPEDCSRCVNSAVDGLLKNCPNQKEAMFSWTWDRPCLVRYTNRSIFGKMELDPSTTLQFTNGDISSNITHFDQTWSSLMATLITTASSNNGSSTHQKYAAGVADLEAFKTIYALTVCTPDITASDCRYCLRQSVSRFQSCCYGKPGGVVQRPSCFFRWNLYPFLNAFANVSSASTPPPPPPTTPESVPSPPRKVAEEAENGNLSRLAIVVFVPTVIAMIAILCAVFYWGTKKREDEVTMLQEDCAIGTETTTETESFQFSLGTIEAATNNFANRLGGGGFGEVYKGTLRHGQQIAVKRLSSSSEQGAEEFKNEVMLLAKLQHRNLVQLLGFCLHENEKILVYEFMPNKSLDYFLFDPEKQRKLNWPRRYKIIRGIARGILYLHQDSQLRIIHRDLKAANILLDKHLNPKISDFGMARIFDVDQTKANTRRIVGTYGYMPPEYAMQGRFSDKSDTYSFGMLVLEIISGKKNSSYYQAHGAVNIVSYVWKHWKKNTALEVMDPTLSNSHSRDEVVRCIHIGLLCVQKDAAKRPTMATVVLMLETHSTSSLPLSQEPAFLFHSKPEGSSPSGDQSDQSGTRSSTISVDEATITELYPR